MKIIFKRNKPYYKTRKIIEQMNKTMINMISK